jgi:photosystem II stability/assembly factor-like uncharacterized protein
MPRRVVFYFALMLLALTGLLAQPPARSHQPMLTPETSGTTNNLIAVSAADERVVWAAGRGGTFTVTTDGGSTWRAGVVKGAEALELRDVEAVSEKIAFVLSVGKNPGDFRIYKTEDGGASWTMQFRNQLDGAFYDCFAFWTPQRGIVQSDSVKGVFPDLRTSDGATWQSIGQSMPHAQTNEGSFASSGTCVATEGKSNAWIATGNASAARVLTTRDGGDTWSPYPVPLPSSQGAGAFSVAFRDARHGMIGGGNLDKKDPDRAATAISEDGGKTWKLTSHPPVTGAVYGLNYVERGGGGQRSGKGGDYQRAVVITANDGGAAWTPDEGTTWHTLPDVSGYWGVAFASPQAGWLVGTKGRILKIGF